MSGCRGDGRLGLGFRDVEWLRLFCTILPVCGAVFARLEDRMYSVQALP